VDPATTVLKYRDEISKDVQIIAMIESIQGLQNAEEIIAVEGITAVFVGPVDLRMSMGLKGGDGTEDDYLEALKKLVRISKAHNKPIGIFADGPDSCRSRACEGFDFLLVCTETPR
jgi:2-keto-3-deoxy-L-rhamnonate aldolase RhmA